MPFEKPPGIVMRLLLTIVACMWFGGAIPAQAQTTPPEVSSSTVADPAPDYEKWAQLAAEVEALLADPEATTVDIEDRRIEVAAWRERFLAAQTTNASRIETIRKQIEAIGPAPAEGETEAEDVARRREELNRQLAVVQAPSIAAVEAYSGADGLISEIDTLLRERFANEIMRRSPAPINPANWPTAYSAVSEASQKLSLEVSGNLSSANRRSELIDNLPAILGLLFSAALLIFRGRAMIEGYALRLAEKSSFRGQEIWSFLASLGQIVVPTAGVLAVEVAITQSGMLGRLSTPVIENLTIIAVGLFVARWLGEQVFPKVATPSATMQLSAEERASGRFLAWMLGLVLAIEAFREVLLPDSSLSETAASVLSFPMVLLAGILLFRLGQILYHHASSAVEDDEVPKFADRIIRIVGRIAMAAALLGPLLSAIGYAAAGAGLVYPATMSLALIGLLFILQRQVGALYALITRNEEQGRDALVPILIGFLLTLTAIPIFALIWGARLADVTEVFTRFREGFQLGQTRILPSDFVLLAVVFGGGFLATRLFQGALKSSILPKTSLDQGGQNAIVAGVGYVGIFLAGLVGINAAGIDLSGLAIVAGALSVGIGFGLQNIVSNFVSGIILLIERPVSEGDWIEVGGVQGTVRSISVRSTRIQTFDRTDVIVPNSDLVSGMVTNWTRFNLAGRLIVPVGVAYGTDTRKVESILKEIAEAQPLAVLNPPPTVVLVGFGADSLDFEIRVILRDVNFSLAVKSEINHEIARRFAEEGIEIPFGQRDIWLRNPEVLANLKPKAEEKKSAKPMVPDEVDLDVSGDGDDL